MSEIQEQYPGDARIKAFLLKRGMAIPTEEQMEAFPEEFRRLEGEPSLQAGCALLRWIVKNHKNHERKLLNYLRKETS